MSKPQPPLSSTSSAANLSVEQVTELITKQVQPLAQRVEITEDALQHHLEMPQRQIQREPTSVPFFLLPDGNRVKLSSVESYRSAGDRRVEIRTDSGHTYHWETPNTGTVDEHHKKRDAVLALFDESSDLLNIEEYLKRKH